MGDIVSNIEITYGINAPKKHDHQRCVWAGDIQHGRVHSQPPDRMPPAAPQHTRALLREGDLAVVLVGDRAGDAALITAKHDGCLATRAVGIIRSRNRYAIRWLRIWLQTPSARVWTARHVSAHVEPTLALGVLKKMPVRLPPPWQIDAVHELVTIIEAKLELNRQIATTAVGLADAHHAGHTRQRASWTSCTFGTVTQARTGKPASNSVPKDGAVSTTWIRPADVLQASLPYLEQNGRQGPADPRAVCEPGTILLASRPEGARCAVNLIPVAPHRGVVAVRPSDPADHWWLLHELRSQSKALSEVAQGRQARELSALAFSRLEVRWPEPEVRHRFHRVADPLHARSQQTLDENRALQALLDKLLHDVSLGRLPANLRERCLFLSG
ncbi:hypothetical protein [Marinactinospora rubrisoli]|uniref:Type I restriction modification DNA specificity domain-containing protein n=1 Tax=Marinactinospora rubrisoli TaxID=2715399 RepID=A0ABW2KB91_9ACTN